MNAVEMLRGRIAEFEAKVLAIQTECSHPPSALTKTHKSDTGNYDPTQDAYWTVFECGLCKKVWTEEGSK